MLELLNIKNKHYCLLMKQIGLIVFFPTWTPNWNKNHYLAVSQISIMAIVSSFRLRYILITSVPIETSEMDACVLVREFVKK